MERSKVGIHTYLGGMSMDCDSFETWEPAISARKVLGNIALGEMPQGFDVVIANPPCSRFSPTASMHFDENHWEGFCELKEIVEAVHYTGAKGLWWETGPLAWNRRDIPQSLHEHFVSKWGRCTTLYIKYDPRWSGVPQRRPRTHILHFQDIEKSSTINKPMKSLEEYAIGGTPYVKEKFWPNSGMGAVKWAEFAQLVGTMKMCNPSIIGFEDRWGPAVFSGRGHVWRDLDRWWSPEEYANYMTYPKEWGRILADEFGESNALTLLSKSVMPVSAECVWDIITGEPDDSMWDGDSLDLFKPINTKRYVA